GQIDNLPEPDQKEIEAGAVRELREEAGYELAKGGELTALGHYFSSPGFSDEHGYFFLARPVKRCREASACDEGEAILDCREFGIEELRRMIAENEIRDANTLSMCARLAVRGFLSLDRYCETVGSIGASRHFLILLAHVERDFRDASIASA